MLRNMHYYLKEMKRKKNQLKEKVKEQVLKHKKKVEKIENGKK